MSLPADNPSEASGAPNFDSVGKSTAITPRSIIFAQLLVTVVAIIAGVSEIYAFMHWAQFLIFVTPLVVVLEYTFPLLTLVRCARLRLRWRVAMFVVSVALSAVSIIGLLPLCS